MMRGSRQQEQRQDQQPTRNQIEQLPLTFQEFGVSIVLRLPRELPSSGQTRHGEASSGSERSSANSRRRRSSRRPPRRNELEASSGTVASVGGESALFQCQISACRRRQLHYGRDNRPKHLLGLRITSKAESVRTSKSTGRCSMSQRHKPLDMDGSAGRVLHVLVFSRAWKSRGLGYPPF